MINKPDVKEGGQSTEIKVSVDLDNDGLPDITIVATSSVVKRVILRVIALLTTLMGLVIHSVW
jgi:hypothetical protein